MRYKIQKYTSSVTIPLGSGSIQDIPTRDINGLLRALVITPPASLTGSSYSAQVGDLNTFSTLSAGSTATKLADANNYPLAIPVACQANNPWLTIAVAGDTGATGVLTSNNTNVSNADTVTIGLLAGGTKVYTFKTALTEAYATGTVTDGNATNVSDGDTLTIGSTVYRFKTVMLAINDVQIGASADATAQSLIYAINGAGTPGTDYFTGTVANTSVSAGTLASHAFTLTALALGTGGNAIVLTTTSAHLTLSAGGTLTGGVNSIANEVKISGVNADGSLTALAAAINGTAGAGTTYSTATVAHPDVTSSAVASHALTITANVENLGGDSITTTKSAVTLSWAHATLTGSGEAAARTFSIEAYIERN